MAVTKKILSQYDVKLVTEWKAPKEDWEMRSLIAMPNIPKPLHGPGCQPRTVLGATTWNRMRNACYTLAGMKCEICGAKVGTDIEKRQLHAHEVYDIDYANGTSVFVRCVALCAECHLACIHTGRALTLYRRGNPLYPKEFLLGGAKKAFETIYTYNLQHPDADLRAYTTYLDYLKVDDLKEPMEELIEKYGTKFYMEDEKKMAKWKDWKLKIGSKEYPTPYENEKAWKEAMEKQGDKDTARLLQKNMEEKFSGGVYDELNKLLNESVENSDRK